MNENLPPSLEETQPSAPPNEENSQKKRSPWMRYLLLGWLLLIVVVGGAAYSGYQRGIQDRISIQSTQAAEEIETQYQLGLDDFDSGEYERARQRFEYIIQQNPNHEGAIEMLARTLAIMQATATPTPLTPTPTPTLTPTPDLRGAEELFSQAKQYMAANDWDAAIATLQNLRKSEPAYQAVEVDSMFYVALRNRGVEKILNTGELESGLYDLSQAERFGPLDAEAQSFANFARFYIIGASFWQVDWGQAAYYFGQVAPYLPNLQDGTGWTATQRYLEAMQNYIDFLVEARDWCRAEEQMEILREWNENPDLEPTQVWLENKCNPPEPTQTPQPETSPTPGPTPTETPAP